MHTPAAKVETVSVLMIAYNAEQTIESAIRSIMNQSFQDWQLIVVDDGSTDRTLSICRGLATKDSRISVFSQENQGITRAANFGLSLCRGRYIARLDADDLAKPERLASQAAFLNANPDVKLLGTWVERISETGEFIDRLRQGPASEEEYEAGRRERTPFWLVHSSIMADRHVFLEYRYRSDDFPADDSNFWNRVALRHRIQVLPEYLTSYRVNSTGSHSSRNRATCFQIARLEYNLSHGTDLSTAQFQEQVQSRPSLRFYVWLLFARKHTVRMAGLAFYKKQPLRAALYVAASVAVNPIFTGKRVFSEVRKRLRPQMV